MSLKSQKEHSPTNAKHEHSALFKKIQREDMARRVFREQMIRFDWKRALSISAVLLFLVTLSIYCLNFYNAWPPPEYSSESVYNLTKESHKWQITSGELTVNKVLPLQMFDFPADKLDDYVTIQTDVRLPQKILEGKNLVFHAFYIWTKSYEMWINGELLGIYKGGNVNVKIPEHLLTPNMQLKLKIDVGEMSDPGFDLYSQIVIGPDELLSKVIYRARGYEDIVAYWNLIPQIAITILFAILFFSFSKNIENTVFVYFGFFSSVNFFLRTNLGNDFITESLPGIDSWLFTKISWFISQFFLVGFIYSFFRRFNPKAKKIWATAFFIFLSISTLALAMSKHQHLGLALSKSTKWMNYFIAMYTLWLGGTTAYYLIKSAKHGLRLLSIGVFTLTILVSKLAIEKIIGNSLLEGFVEYNPDLIFFLILACLVAIDFANTAHARDGIQEKLQKLVDSRMMQAFSKNKAGALTSETEVIILFVDIRSFAQLCDNVSSSVVTDIINSYFQSVSSCIESEGGIIDKYMGDGVLAYWGIPTLENSDSEKAIRAVLKIRESIQLFNEHQNRYDLPEIQVCAAIHRGTVIAGILGSQSRVDYTIIGKHVNLTARIEQLSKVIDADIVLTDDFLSKCSSELVTLDKGEQTIRGIHHRKRLYSLVGVKDELGNLKAYSRHVENYYHQVVTLKQPTNISLLQIPDYQRQDLEKLDLSS